LLRYSLAGRGVSARPPPPPRLLMNSGALDERANLDIGEHRFRLVRVTKTGDDYTLEFEDRDISRLRLVTTPRKVSRGKVTRAEFAKMLVDETPGIGFFCPDLHVKQQVDAAATPIGAAPTDPTPVQLSKGAKSKGLGFPPGVKLSVGGSPANAHQLAEAARLLSVAAQLNAPPVATLAMIFAGIAETKMGGNAGSYAPNSAGLYGLLQSSPRNFPDPHDTAAFARAFLLGGKGFQSGGGIALSKTVKNPVEIAVRVEVPSIWPNNSYATEVGYSNFLPEARRIIEAYTGQPLDASLGGDTTSNDLTYATPTVTTIAKPYEFTRGLPNMQPGDKPENTWDCLKRLADEVQRRRFLIDRTVTFAFEKDLLKLAPVMTISETDAGIDWIDFDRDEGKHVESATVTCRVEAWAAPPGSVVVVEDLGDASGRWLVSRISGSLFLPGRTIELTRGLKKLREPAHETTMKVTEATPSQTTTQGGTSNTLNGGAGGKWKYGAGVPQTLNSGMKSFIDRMATFYDGTLVATTTTNHSYLTADGNVSDHNGGGAADFGSVANGFVNPDGQGGFKIAIAAYQACGKSYTQAVSLANIPSYDRVPCQESSRGAQILWRVTGHHDHVHVGLGPVTRTFGGNRP
jgi:hypothetical protein